MEDVLAKLQEQGLLDADAVQQARDAVAAGQGLDQALRGVAGAAEEKILRWLAGYFDLPFVDLEANGAKLAPGKQLLEKFPARILLDRHVMPLASNGDGQAIVTCNVFDSNALDEIRLATGLDVHAVLAPSAEIDRFLKKYLGVGADTLQSMGEQGDDDVKVMEEQAEDDLDLTNAAQDASIIRFVNQVLAEALELRATDVHVEPFENQLRVRYRVDGVLQEANIPPQVRKYQAAIVSRLKILSHLDIAEKRLPQDGRIRLRVAGREIDLRVSVIPMIHGEAVVLRILDRGDALLGLEHLGMSARDQAIWQRMLDLPHGIILVTGPTGSGKTTTLYAALSKINTTDLKIITVEDPVEYQLRGINQIQVNVKSGLTFAAGLRSILRHDPDVVLIGEIRDHETAEIAVQASLTGHLVFSTLHTNDAPGAATRLVDMGIEPYLVTSSLEVVMAQRLVRLICPNCKTRFPQAEADKLRKEFGDLAPAEIYRGAGCRNCLGTGYRGRQGVFEMMPVSDEIRALILAHASSRDIRKTAVEQGMNSLRDDGWRLIREGRTTPEEVLRLTKKEEATVGRREDDPDMTMFAYTALLKDGRRTSGTLSAESRAVAISQIGSKGMHPVSVEEAADAAAATRKAQAAAAAHGTSGRVPQRAVEAFTRELANLLAGGVPLSRSLALLRREASHPAARQLWSDIHDDVVGGTALADAMAKWPRTFYPVYVAMIRAGEAGGFLDVVLGQIADFRTREQDLKGKVKAAMIYPIILAVVAVVVLVLLLTFFIPRFTAIFASFNGDLPYLTQAIVGLSNLVYQYGLYVAAALVLGFFLLRRAVGTDTGRRKLEVMLLAVPVLGRIIASFALVRFARMLGTLLGAGVPLIAALRVAREAIGNQTLSDTVGHAIEQVQRGAPLSKSLAETRRLFPTSVIEMIAVAEETGRLDKELLRLAQTYESDLDRQLRMLVAIAEPAMLFIMAMLIGTVVLGMLLPVFNLSNVVH